MKLAERQLLLGTSLLFIDLASSTYQERLRSPEADLGGSIVGGLSVCLLAPITYCLAKKEKKIKDAAYRILIVGSLGFAWTAATLMGKSWKDWTGNWALAFGAILLGQVSRNKEKPGQLNLKGYAVFFAGSIAEVFLQKSRNPSLNVTPYLVHRFARPTFRWAWERFSNKCEDEDKKRVYLAVAKTIVTLLVAKVIEWKVGDKAFKFSYKADLLHEVGILGVYTLFLSKRSPIVEQAKKKKE